MQNAEEQMNDLKDEKGRQYSRRLTSPSSVTVTASSKTDTKTTVVSAETTHHRFIMFDIKTIPSVSIALTLINTMKLLLCTTLFAVEAAHAFTCHRPMCSNMLTARKMAPETEEKSGFFSDEIQQEAKEVLEKAGWARPEGDGEMTSADPFVQQINAGIQEDYGFGLDDLLNPAKVL
jgi:hypothetical protein